ncbi:nitroreductase [Actinoplanes couchii]|uniref:Nitroreductase NfnB n=1 Tax=Actinoplanes couchii TaxID=403638 RepID=A0ABQ3XTY3_9ACTN|nr:nitroreductase [Actinoplanes couchii]MDR6317768.1 nitroreductase [Actinoplanes couchii]GID61936.1 nitroreductase NfnB [Actinoplanes couchii]
MTTTSTVEQVIRGRRATRAFRSDAVPAETIEAIFDLARNAPSNSNTQPWRVEVVSGAARERVADALVAAHEAGRRTVDFPYREDIFEPVHQQRRRAWGAEFYGALGVGRGDTDTIADLDRRSLRFYEAPHVAFLFAPDSGDPRLTADVGMYAQTLLLAMTAYGIASCPQALLSFYADTVRETLGVTGGKLLFGVAFGYADPTATVNTVVASREPLAGTTRFHTL